VKPAARQNPPSGALSIRPADGADLPAIRDLLREYEAGAGVSLCFQGFEAELNGLPGKYAPPKGRLLVAVRSGRIMGCVALRPLHDDICEMKRLYVRPEARGLGAGRALVARIIREAAQAGYRAMRLDTLPTMTQALALYHSLGFKPIAPYCHNPVPGATYLELDLNHTNNNAV